MRRLVQCMMLLPLFLVGLPTTSAQVVQTQATQVQTFDVTVSLEWQPGTDDLLHKDLSMSQCNPSTGAGGNYLDELRAGLSRASEYLALYTDGQMQLGTVTVYTGGVNWNSANIRVLADSGYRPKAFVGGIVSAPMTYTSPHTQRTQTFYPGAIYLGRLWDGSGARCGGWSLSDGYRTIGHEWAHYALYLYDEYYQQHDHTPVYCTSTGQHLPSVPAGDSSIDQNDSLMAYHYRAGQLWRGNASNGTCDFTPQMRIHGEPDWETVQRFYPGMVIPAAPTSAPSTKPIQWSVVSADTLPLHSSANVRVRDTITTGPRLSGHGYIVRTIDRATLRIIGQGEIAADEAAPLPFLGVEDPSRDRAVVVMQDPRTAAHFTANSTRTSLVVGQDKINELYLQRSNWRPCISTTPTFTTAGGISQVTQLTVRLRDCAYRTNQVQLAYCPAGGNCQALVTKTIDANSNFVHTFSFPWGSPPADYGYIYARSADSGEEPEETIAWYQLAGGVGPATITGHAPLLERTVDLAAPNGSQPMSKTDSIVLYSGAPAYCAASTSMPPDVAGIINIPLDVQPVVSQGTSSIPWSMGRSDPALTVRLSYNQDLLNRLRISEKQLVLLRLDPQGGWHKLLPRQRSVSLDWLAFDVQQFNGAGLTFALAYLKS
jgi:hypothetical protein